MLKNRKKEAFSPYHTVLLLPKRKIIIISLLIIISCNSINEKNLKYCNLKFDTITIEGKYEHKPIHENIIFDSGQTLSYIDVFKNFYDTSMTNYLNIKNNNSIIEEIKISDSLILLECFVFGNYYYVYNHTLHGALYIIRIDYFDEEYYVINHPYLNKDCLDSTVNYLKREHVSRMKTRLNRMLPIKMEDSKF